MQLHHWRSSHTLFILCLPTSPSLSACPYWLRQDSQNILDTLSRREREIKRVFSEEDKTRQLWFCMFPTPFICFLYLPTCTHSSKILLWTLFHKSEGVIRWLEGQWQKDKGLLHKFFFFFCWRSTSLSSSAFFQQSNIVFNHTDMWPWRFSHVITQQNRKTLPHNNKRSLCK